MNAIEAVNLGKCYTRKGLGAPTLFGALTGNFRKKNEPFWCLRGANFEIPAGRTIGVIGPNGSGKSSLLGLAAGTITPTEGACARTGASPRCSNSARGSTPTSAGARTSFSTPRCWAFRART
jgi:ABC-type polysaccharide/polyol phosphate transport system ATPase subunit